MDRKYIKVMFGNKSYYENNVYEYKINKVNIAECWNPNDLQNIWEFNFSTEDKIARWLVRGDTIYDVTIPYDAEIIEVTSESSPHGVFRSNKIILRNPRKITDELALELYRKSNLPEKSYFKTLAGYAIRGHINAEKEIIKDKVNYDNIELVLCEINDFCKPDKGKFETGSYDCYIEIINILKNILIEKNKKLGDC